MRPTDTVPKPSRRRVPLVASGLVLFAGTALVASEIAAEYRSVGAIRGRTVITIDAPGVLGLRDGSASGVASGLAPKPTYGCKRVLALGDVEIGRSCHVSPVTLAQTRG